MVSAEAKLRRPSGGAVRAAMTQGAMAKAPTVEDEDGVDSRSKVTFHPAVLPSKWAVVEPSPDLSKRKERA